MCDSELPLSLLFYDFMYTLVRSNINEEKHKVSIMQLEKARKLADTINPLKSVEEKYHEIKNGDPTENDLRGMNFLDRFSNELGKIGEFLFKKKNPMQKYEKLLK